MSDDTNESPDPTDSELKLWFDTYLQRSSAGHLVQSLLVIL